MYGFCRSSTHIFHLECLLFWVKSQPGVAYKQVVYKKAFNLVFKSSKTEEITLLHEFIFVFIWYFIGAILLEKSCQKWGIQKKNIKRGMSIYRGAQTFCMLWYWEAGRGELGVLNYWGDLNWRGDFRPLFIPWIYLNTVSNDVYSHICI